MLEPELEPTSIDGSDKLFGFQRAIERVTFGRPGGDPIPALSSAQATFIGARLRPSPVLVPIVAPERERELEPEPADAADDYDYDYDYDYEDGIDA